jgi:FkbM family methyltransferase
MLQETVLTQANVRIECHLNQMIQRQLYFWGSYEKDCCALWMRLAQGADTVFDIGANVGLYSLLAASTNPSAQIHAFEPTSAVIALLRTNIALNGFNNITVNDCAIGEHCGKGLLRECRGIDNANEGMNFVASDSLQVQPTDLPIAIVSLDDYAESHGINHIDLVKIDIEGGEYEALLGAKRLLSSGSISCLFVEFMEWAANRSGHSTADIKHLLQSAGYHLYTLQRERMIEIRSDKLPDSENVIALSSKFFDGCCELRVPAGHKSTKKNGN